MTQHRVENIRVHFWTFSPVSVNSQAPDVPELAHQGIFQLSQLSVLCQIGEEISRLFKRCRFYEKNFSKNYTLYGVEICFNFGLRLNRLSLKDKKTHFHIESYLKIITITR